MKLHGAKYTCEENQYDQIEVYWCGAKAEEIAP